MPSADLNTETRHFWLPGGRGQDHSMRMRPRLPANRARQLPVRKSGESRPARRGGLAVQVSNGVGGLPCRSGSGAGPPRPGGLAMSVWASLYGDWWASGEGQGTAGPPRNRPGRPGPSEPEATPRMRKGTQRFLTGHSAEAICAGLCTRALLCNSVTQPILLAGAYTAFYM